MIQFGRYVSLVLLLALLSVAACDEDNSRNEAFLRRLHEAEDSQGYVGMKRIILNKGDGMKTFHYFVRHYPSTADSSSVTVMETGRQTSRRPMERVMWSSRHAFWTRHSDLLLENYRIERRGQTTVAGRSARIFRIRSKHDESKRPSVCLAVDEETDIVLRYESFDWRGGDATVVAEFTSVDLHPGEIPDRPKRRERRPGFDMWGMPPPAPRADEPLGFVPHTPRWLPEGFRATSGPVRFGWGRTGTRTVYSDGLAWFTLQQTNERTDREERVVRCGRKGPRVTMEMAHEGVSIKIFGSIDPKDLEQVLGSLGHVR